MKQIYYTLLIGCLLLVIACTPQPENVTDTTEPAPIYPDYTDITLPYNIAPLNFLLRNEAEAVQVTLTSKNENWTFTSDNLFQKVKKKAILNLVVQRYA